MRYSFTCALACCVAALAADQKPGLQRVWADELTNTLGSPSPDGRYLSFADARSGALSIRENATGAVRSLTPNGTGTTGEFAYFSSFSPDSRRVAFAWFNEAGFYELRVVNIDGSGLTTVYRNEEVPFVQPCAWSPDGRQILTLLFRKDNISQIALTPADGGAVRVLKSLNWVYPKRMDFSPDGKSIVYDSFARNGSGRRDIYRLAVDGSKESVLVEDPGDDLFPVWSRDGESVFFASDRGGSMGLWRVPASGGTPSLVRADIGRFLPMGLTRDGQLFFGLRDGGADIYIAALSNTKASVARTRFPGRNSTPAWSPDGRYLAFLSRRGTENYGQDSRGIVLHTVESGEERDLRTNLAHIEAVRWSSDGQRLLASGSDGKGRGGLFVVSIATGRVEPVVTGASFRGYSGAWGADGSILFARDRAIFVHGSSEEDRKLRSVDCDPAHLATPADGSHVAFACGSSVFVMPADGSQLVRVAQVSPKYPITGVSWTPAGDVLFTSGATLLRASPERGAATVGTFTGSHGDIALHPDGDTIAFTSGSTRSEVWVLRVSE